MARKKKAAAAGEPAMVRKAEEDSTTFAPLESPSGTELSDKERAEQTRFKPLTKDDGNE